MIKEKRFITAMTIIGGIVGFWIISILMAIAVPVLDSYILTKQEWRQFELMRKAAELFFWTHNNVVMLGIGVLITVAALALLLRVVNPHIGKATFTSRGPFLRFAIAFVLSFIVTPLAIVLLKEVLSIRSGILDVGLGSLTHKEAVKSIVFEACISYGVQFGIIWAIVGEQGWLGDLSSWKVNLRAHWPRFRRVFSYGAAVGIGAAAVLVLQSWFFGKYFVVVSEVLDRTGETSFIGFVYLLVEWVALLAAMGCVFSGLAVALAPVDRAAEERKRLLRLPIGVFAALAIVMVVFYAFSSIHYDLNKKDLATAVGIRDTASVSKTLILTESGKGRRTPRAMEWPLRAEASGMLNTSTFEVSPESLRKIADYLNNRPQGSVFQYVAEDALIKGYNVLGETEKSLEYQKTFSQEMLLPRVMLVARLRAMPVTKKTRMDLDFLADKNQWHIGGRYALKLAEAFVHQGRLPEARTWYDKAMEKSVNSTTRKEVEKVSIPKGPVLTAGRITGNVRVNGTVPKGAMVLLFADNGHALAGNGNDADSLRSVRNAMSVRMASLQTVDSSGRFAFDRLGAGSYLIALLLDQARSNSAQTVKMRNDPGVFRLDRKHPSADLGAIAIAVK